MSELNEIRAKIDELDFDLELLIATRVALTRQAFDYKTKENLPLFDPAREQEILNALQTELHPIFIEIIKLCKSEALDYVSNKNRKPDEMERRQGKGQPVLAPEP